MAVQTILRLRVNAHLGFSESVMFLAKDAPAQLIGLSASPATVCQRFPYNATRCCVGVGVGIRIVGGFVNFLRAVLDTALNIQDDG